MNNRTTTHTLITPSRSRSGQRASSRNLVPALTSSRLPESSAGPKETVLIGDGVILIGVPESGYWQRKP